MKFCLPFIILFSFSLSGATVQLPFSQVLTHEIESQGIDLDGLDQIHLFEKAIDKTHSQAFEEADIDPYFVIDSVEVTEVEALSLDLMPESIDSEYANFDKESENNSNKNKNNNNPFDVFDGSGNSSNNNGNVFDIFNTLGDVISIFDNLIAFGNAVMDIVERGRPVAEIKFRDAITVIPNSKTDNSVFMEIQEWSPPIFKRYRTAYKNKFGSEVVAFEYTIQFQARGNLKGKGAYLAGLAVTASNVKVGWGFSFNAKSKLIGISNRGTHEDPIASATMNLDYNVSSMVSNVTTGENFHVTGEGEVLKF